MATTTIQQRWETYLREVIPVDAPAIQIGECRRAFFAGASGMFLSMQEASADPVSEDDGVVELERLNQEIQTFVRDVVDGRGVVRSNEVRSSA